MNSARASCKLPISQKDAHAEDAHIYCQLTSATHVSSYLDPAYMSVTMNMREFVRIGEERNMV